MFNTWSENSDLLLIVLLVRVGVTTVYTLIARKQTQVHDPQRTSWGEGVKLGPGHFVTVLTLTYALSRWTLWQNVVPSIHSTTLSVALVPRFCWMVLRIMVDVVTGTHAGLSGPLLDFASSLALAAKRYRESCSAIVGLITAQVDVCVVVFVACLHGVVDGNKCL